MAPLSTKVAEFPILTTLLTHLDPSLKGSCEAGGIAEVVKALSSNPSTAKKKGLYD
jgi:hypothetical protein